MVTECIHGESLNQRCFKCDPNTGVELRQTTSSAAMTPERFETLVKAPAKADALEASFAKKGVVNIAVNHHYRDGWNDAMAEQATSPTDSAHSVTVGRDKLFALEDQRNALRRERNLYKGQYHVVCDFLTEARTKSDAYREALDGLVEALTSQEPPQRMSIGAKVNLENARAVLNQYDKSPK